VPVAVSPDRARPDVGRLVMVPAFAVALVAAAFRLDHGSRAGADVVLRPFGTVLVLAFYALAIWCYLRRSQPVATSRSVTAHGAAFAATWLPLVLPLFQGAPPGPGRQAVADVLLIFGTGWAVWSLRYLHRSVSVLAQARELVAEGPYRWVRHPLYVGELVSSLGLAIAVDSYPALALWFAMCGLQVYRAVREEQVLSQALPAYPGYRSRTAALLPGVF
jgi:protein-S-isoprenylcysteine O-methyltransferase Ste14